MITKDELVQLWNSDITVVKVREKLGRISERQLYKYLKLYDIPKRKRGGVRKQTTYPQTIESAYVMGLAIGDGNISKLKRTLRLRLYCDERYKKLIDKWKLSCENVFQRRVSISNHHCGKCKIISIHTNALSTFPWEPNKGHKWKQKVKIPDWIIENEEFLHACMRGLFETDGC
ncbi:MAG: hypothetical protein AABY32_00885 [Nanoarchaeota archaeon]